MSKLNAVFDRNAGIWRAAITLGVLIVIGLQGFMVTRREFESYSKGHKDYGDSVIKRFDDKFDETHRRLIRIENKLDKVAFKMGVSSDEVFGLKQSSKK